MAYVIPARHGDLGDFVQGWLEDVKMTVKQLVPFLADPLETTTTALGPYVSRVKNGFTGGIDSEIPPSAERITLLSRFLYMTSLPEDDVISTTFEQDSRFKYPPPRAISPAKRDGLIETARVWNSMTNDRKVARLQKTDRVLATQIYERTPDHHEATDPYMVHLYVSGLMSSAD